ncbi:MAG TPA: VOC family protein [Chloroflexota bacterium]|jgi:catechol 2,3-dioxygenase-like lactoylglutathione lyase family enzyme|nr:VOC family protein [Chloroflexota bacterium]
MAVVLNKTLKSTKPAGSMKINGLHHLALYTHDMDATTHFYAEVLDMPLVLTDAPAGGALERHYFFDTGAGGTLAFFSRRGDAPKADYAAARKNSLHHICLTIDTMEDLEAARARLDREGVAYRQVDHGYCMSVYLQDPVNDITLELSVWTVEASPEHPHQQDSDPTPTARRLLAGR